MTRSERGAGGALFGAVMMIIVGVLQAFVGLVALLEQDVLTEGKGLLDLDPAAWGWTHLILGLLVAFVGLGVLSGAAWARFTGIVIVTLSLIANFAFAPNQPVWAVVLMALDVWIIWSLGMWEPADVS